MSEAEFNRMLDAVRTAIEPEENFELHSSTFLEPPKAANDNHLVWPFIPFPEGWYAAC